MLGMSDTRVYEFGQFSLDVEVRRLTRGGQVVPLTARLLDILLLLVRHRGEIVSKDYLLREVWAGLIIEENNLTVAISALRKALGEKHGGHEYIETVPKQGYRFVAKVRESNNHDEETGETTQSIAVLPFENRMIGPEMDYLTDGITEEVIGKLSRLTHLRVMAFSTTSQYKGRSENPLVAGREMGVGLVLTGKLRRSAGELFVSVELVSVKDGTRIWGKQYESELSGIISLQELIAQEVSENLPLKLTRDESHQLVKGYTGNVEAYYFYLKGRYFWNLRTAEGIRKGIQCFEEAIRIDSRYALAYAGLADGHHTLATWNVLPPDNMYSKAREAALKALEIDDALSEAHASYAYIAFHSWNWREADKEFKKAIALNPNNDTALRWYSIYLGAMGRIEEALELVDKALKLDPLSSHTRTQVARLLYYARQYDRAVEQCDEAIELHPKRAAAPSVRGLIYIKQERYEEAIASITKGHRLLPDDPESKALVGHAYGSADRVEEALQVLDGLLKLSRQRYVPPHLIAWIYIGLRDLDNAFAWLEKSYAERSYVFGYVKAFPLFDPIRSDPRYVELIARVGLE